MLGILRAGMQRLAFGRRSWIAGHDDFLDTPANDTFSMATSPFADVGWLDALSSLLFLLSSRLVLKQGWTGYHPLHRAFCISFSNRHRPHFLYFLMMACTPWGGSLGSARSAQLLRGR